MENSKAKTFKLSTFAVTAAFCATSLFLPCAACGATTNPAAGSSEHSTTPARGARSGIGIAPGDLLKIGVFDVPQLSQDYRVHSDGQIELPLLPKPVQAAGLSADELAAVLSNDLRTSGVLSHPQVTVEIKESLARSVTIAGAVKNPQVLAVFGHITLLDAISQAGGLSKDAGSTATITRGPLALTLAANESGQGSAPQSLRGVSTGSNVDLDRLMKTGDPGLNPELFPGDRVVVEKAGVVYVVGAVNRAGGFLLSRDRGPMTLLKALALSEGLKSTAVANKALILRGSGQTQAQLPARLKDVLAGRAPDQRLEANDILFIPDSNSEKAIRRGAEAAVEIATGIVIWRL
jgi:polysaccharide export outer membrane protein